MNEQLDLKESKCRQLQEDLDLKDNECRSLQSQSEKHASVFKNEIQAVEKERDDLQRARELHDKTTAVKLAALQKKINDLTLFSQDTVENQDQDHQKNLKKVEVEHKQKEAEQMKTWTTKERNWSSTRDKLKHQLQVAAAKEEDLKQQIAVRAKEVAELKTKTDNFDRLVDIVTKQRDTQGETIENLNAELDKAQRKLATARSLIEERNRKIQEWKDFYERVRWDMHC